MTELIYFIATTHFRMRIMEIFWLVTGDECVRCEVVLMLTIQVLRSEGY